MERFVPHSTAVQSAVALTQHAVIRMQQRGITETDIRMVIRFGRRIRVKAITYYVLGRKEIQRYAVRGFNFSDLHGLQVLVCAEGKVITTYRNQDFRSIKSSGHRPPRSNACRYH